MKKYAILLLSILLLTGCSSTVDVTKEITFIDTGVNPNTWVKIPAGEFLKGLHAHETLIDYDYEIMITDVTNEQYVRYLNDAFAKNTIQISDDQIVGFQPGELFDGYNHEVEITAGDKLYMRLDEPGLRIRYNGHVFSVTKGYENHPVVMITWFGAKAFAEFQGWRLPTENEWEKAARGSDDRAYPWGNEIARNQANYYSSHHLFDKLFGHQSVTTPVGFYNGKTYDGYETKPGISPYGLHDMAGNVWQWTGDDYHNTHLRYMRGGSQANYEYNLRIWTRNSAGPEHYGINIGFRCVRGGENKVTQTTKH